VVENSATCCSRARRPELVSRAISMGADRQAMFHCGALTEAPFPTDRVRLMSIYSKGDGVVRWQAQIVLYAECVEVTGSHVGLLFNRKSYRVIARALAAPEPAG
jgi:hypothetical protein